MFAILAFIELITVLSIDVVEKSSMEIAKLYNMIFVYPSIYQLYDSVNELLIKAELKSVLTLSITITYNSLNKFAYCNDAFSCKLPFLDK